MRKSIDSVKSLLEAKLRGLIKNFYVGDPWIFPESLMPALMLCPNHTDTDIIDNQRDSHTHFIDISLVIDARQFFNATPDTMVGTDFLMKTMENELSDGTIDPNSVLGILRDNLDLDTNRHISNISSIDYSVRRRTKELITLEATCKIEIQYFINR